MLSVPYPSGGVMVERPTTARQTLALRLGRFVPKTLNMVAITSLLGAQHYRDRVAIKGSSAAICRGVTASLSNLPWT